MAVLDDGRKIPQPEIARLDQNHLASADRKPELPENFRNESKMVLEVNRLSLKLNQLLQFSRPPSSVIPSKPM